jgi:crotonobetainyl-CoA:carnitine CoA-transferase CaiB-like acyl-CoA transferase
MKDDILLVPCYTAEDILSDEHLQSREFWWDMDACDRGYPSALIPGPFAKMSGTPLQLHRGAPSIGQHNEEVYSRLIGLTKNKLGRLIDKGVI